MTLTFQLKLELSETDGSLHIGKLIRINEAKVDLKVKKVTTQINVTI
jgi:hypothetical protein